MIVEVVAVGTELLLGQIVNSNAAVIGERLAAAGLDHFHQQVVGDNLERVASVVRSALDRADAVIVTGGIGPTQDDITREAICAAADLTMEFDADYAAFLAERWAARGREMPESNLRQAEYPHGATRIPNPKGTAPGLVVPVGSKVIVAVPGVPEEMIPMLDHHVVPHLVARAGGDQGVLMSRVIRTWGESESRIADMFDDLFSGSANPTVAFLASAGEIKIRLTAKAGSPGDAARLIAPIEDEVRRRLGDKVFGVDSDTIEVVLHRLLLKRGWTIGTAESATAGKVAARITSVPGASEVFRGSIVAYRDDVKERLLGVPGTTLEAAGAVSEATARAMAAGAVSRLGVDVAVAVTGSAGPDPQDRPVGTMVVAVTTPDHELVRTLQLPGDRERVRTYATTAALHLARLAITRSE